MLPPTNDEPDLEAASDPANDPASAAAPPSRRSAILRSGLIVGVLVVVFLIILPRYIDYQEVAAAFSALTLGQIALMTVLGVIAWFVSGLVFCALIPGLSIIRGPTSWLILSGIGSSVPFGPWNMGVLWVVVRGWGVANIPATSGIALYGIVNELSRLFLPLFAVMVLAATGDLASAQNADKAWAIAILSAIAFVVVTALIIAVVRSERAADWLGRTGQRIVSWTLRRLGREGAPDVSASIHRFRDQLGFVIRGRGLAALAVSIASQFAWVVVLTVALRMTGVPESALSCRRDLRCLRARHGAHDHPALAGRGRRARVAVHLGVHDDRRYRIRGRDHGRCLPLSPLLLVPADPAGVDPA